MALKYLMLRLLRSCNLLRFADSCKFKIEQLFRWPGNRQFRKENPNFPVPPSDLMFDALNHSDWTIYRQTGISHAKVFTDIISKNLSDKNLDILEWGCGPGRLIRHMSTLLQERQVRLTGSDFNEQSIQWCKENLHGIDFVVNQIFPPLPLDANRFDAVCNFSVFTHLSHNSQIDWAKELHRILKPGGLMICTTHGDNYRHLLSGQSEMADYEEGKVVIQGRYSEGKKWFFAIHPPIFVRNELLKHFSTVKQLKNGVSAGIEQDIWLCIK